MTDKLPPDRRSENMRKIRSKGMLPEMRVRSLVHRMGFRFRLHRKDLPGTPDLVFPSRRKAVFVHGCFWHQHPSSVCKIVRKPKSNLDYWLPKLDRNVQRDKEHRKNLNRMGWKVLVVWECETVDTLKLQKKIRRFLVMD